MKFYNSMGPNPKLVRMFAVEKGYSFAAIEAVDLIQGANRKEPYLSKNPAGQLPCVELADGRFIAETIAICELIEEKQPRPALIGTTPEDRAETRMWVRRIEWKIVQPAADGFRFAEGLPIFKDRMRTVPEAADGLLRRAHWNVKAAIVMQKSGLTYPQALSRLRRAHDFVREAIGEDVEGRLKDLLKVG